MRVRRLVAALLALSVATTVGFAGKAVAQNFPERPVRIVVAQPPGGGPDKIARLVAEHLSKVWGEAVVVENRSGAGGTIGAELVAKANPDGYTLLLGSQSALTVAYVTNPDLRYRPLTDFAPIGRIASIPSFLVVSSAVPARTFAQLIAHARAHPGQLTLSSFGGTTVSGLAFRRLVAETGIDIVEIYYRDSAVALTDLLAGRVDIGLLNYADAKQHAATGRLHIIGATTLTRPRFAPDVPTIVEQGVPWFHVETWYGFVAPAGVPPEILARLRDALDQIQRSPELRRRIEQFEAVPIIDDAAQFGAVMRSDIEEFSRRVKPTGAAK